MDPLPLQEFDPERETERICRLVSRLASERKADGLVLGLSGGIDSSVVAELAARALGPERIHALLLPERDSSKASVEDARAHAERIGIRYRIQDLTSALEELGCYEAAASGIARMGKASRAVISLFPGLARKGFLAHLSGGGGRSFREFTAFYRIKHRLRMVAVYREAEGGNLLAASCANRTEYETGFFVRYGDDAGDIAPIKHLYKTQIFRMAAHLGVPRPILEKGPSPDLFSGMKDEEIMGMRYPELDSILWCVGRGLTDEVIVERTGSKRKAIAYVREIIGLSGRLREPPADLME